MSEYDYQFSGKPEVKTCDKCGRESTTAICRSIAKEVHRLERDPATLCETCCATYPGREWMAR